MKNITLLTPMDAQKICNVIPSSLDAIHNNGYLKKYWYDASFFYDKGEIECLIGLDVSALLNFKGINDFIEANTQLENRLKKSL